MRIYIACTYGIREMHTRFGTLGRYASWLGLSHIVVTLIYVALQLIITNRGGALVYGQLILILQSGELLYSIIDAKVWELVITYVPRFQSQGQPDQARRILHLACWLEAGTAIAVGSAYFVAAPWFAAQFFDGAIDLRILRTAAVVFVFRAPVELANILLEMARQYRTLAIIRVSVATIQLCMLVLLATTANVALQPLILVEVLAKTAQSLLLIGPTVLAVRTLGLTDFWQFGLRPLGRHVRDLSVFLLSTHISRSTVTVRNKVDTPLLGWFTDPATVGVYALARRIVHHTRFVVTRMSRVLYPEFSQLVAQQAFSQLRRTVALALALTLPLMLVGVLAFAGPMSWLLPVVYGEEFRASIPLVRILAIILLALPFIALKPILVSGGFSQAVAVIDVVATLILLGAALAILPVAGGIGLAWVVLFSQLFYGALIAGLAIWYISTK